MKTLEDLCKEISTSEELKKAFAQATKENKVADFLKANGCDATEDDFKTFLAEKAGSDKALSEEDLENVAGGFNPDRIPITWTPGGCQFKFTTAEVLCK